MASTMEDSDLLALRSEVLATRKMPAILPSTKLDDEDEDLEALRQAALLSIKPAPKKNQANVTSTGNGQNRNPFKCKFYGHRRTRGGNHIMRNYKRSNLIVISTDDVSENSIKPAVKNSTFFNSKNMKFSVLNEESSSPKINFPRSKGTGRFSRFESDSNSAESDSDSDFNRDGSEYFTYSDDRESIHNSPPSTEINLSLQECTDIADSAVNGLSRDQLDVRLPYPEKVQNKLEEERTSELQQFSETGATIVKSSTKNKILNNDHSSKPNDSSIKQDNVAFIKKPAKTENTASSKEKLCISSSSIDKDLVMCSPINYKDSEVNKFEPNCQKHIAKEHSSSKISFKLRNEYEKEKLLKKDVSEKLDFATKGFYRPHKREKREIVLIKPEKKAEDQLDKHYLEWDLRMHLTSNSCKESPHHLSRSSMSSSSSASSSENETSSSNSDSSRTCSGGSRSSGRSSQSSRSPIPVLKSVVGEIKQDKICEILPSVSNLRREKSQRKETKISGCTNKSRGLHNLDRTVTCMLPSVQEKSVMKSRKCESPLKLPAQSVATKYVRGVNRRNAHLPLITDQKDVEEKTRTLKYNSFDESLSVNAASSHTEPSVKFNNQSRRHSKDVARDHSRNRCLEENQDNKSKSNRKHQESVLSSEELPKKLPIHFRLGPASKYVHKHDKRNSRLSQTGDEKEKEERIRDPKYISCENSTVEVPTSFIECSAKSNSQSRHHNRDSARKYNRKRSSEESLDNRGKRFHYSRKHHESGIRNKKENKLDMKVHRTKSIIQQY